eukprot:CAMPEP_0178992466 /NCGR_PEP_ID=MMETSP0795-20121207/6129_1 /TAXON_ID=88552 /ORGANISM="Amoebophrya sp., Strain Ameob2" /LENGTH=426 /DNA_ID=CAMNT_0020684349 /DNA_START=277 /DNA_END=1557 /DNA_ORIENTATION=-
MNAFPVRVLLLLLCFVANAPHTSIHAYPSNKQQIPNADKFPYLGHVSGGPPTRNAFGSAFAANGWAWDAVLCQADTDGDGFSNGEELGDPNCTWRQGDPMPVCGGNGCPAHPGDASDAGACGTGTMCGTTDTESRMRLHAWLMICVWLIFAPIMIAIVFVRRKMLVLLMGAAERRAGEAAAGESETKQSEGAADSPAKGIAERLMLTHKLGQGLTIALLMYAFTLPFQHDHGSDHRMRRRRRLSGGDHSGPSLHGILGFAVLILAIGQLLLWLGKKYYLYRLKTGQESSVGVVSKMSSVVEDGVATSTETKKAGVVIGEVAVAASGVPRPSAAAATGSGTEDFNKKWLLMHRFLGLLCAGLALLNCLSGAFKFTQQYNDASFTPIVLGFAAFSVVLVAGSWFLGDKVARLLVSGGGGTAVAAVGQK